MNHRPATRVLATLELLQKHKRMRGADLAQRLGVSVRTVRRYVAALEDIGIPVLAEHGRDGAYTLVAGFKLPPMMFTDDEALALSIGLSAVRGLGIAEAVPAADSAQAKLERVMPEPVRHRLGEINDIVRLTISCPDVAAPDVMLGPLSAAARGRRRVRFRYQTADGETTSRDVDPYGLSYQWGRWYVVGWCHLRQAMRTFRLDRVGEVVQLQHTFSRPEGFDVLEFLERSFAAMPRAYAVEVLLTTDLPTARAHAIGKLGLLEPRDDGVLLRAGTDHLDWLAGLLAALPFDFRVLTPTELAAALRGIAGRIERATAARQGCEVSSGSGAGG